MPRLQGPLSLVAALSLIASACGSAPAASEAAVAGLVSAPPASSAPAAPTAPPDLAGLLRDRFASITSGDQRVTGTLRIGEMQATFDGTLSVNGPDTTMSLAMTVGGTVTVEQRTKVAGARFVKHGDGPWLKDVGADSSGSADLQGELEAALVAAVDLDAGASGTAPHRLASTVASFDPSRFGFAIPGQATPGTGTITFRAMPDGAPVSVTIAGTWMAPSGKELLDASMEINLEFTRINSRPVIAAPADVWTSFTSEGLGYSQAVPPTFDHVTDAGTEYFLGPDDRAGDFGTARLSTSGYKLNTLAESELESWTTELSVIKSTNEATTLGGERARLLSASGRSKKLGGKVTVYEAIAVHGKHYYIVFWIGPTAGAALGQPMMKQLLASFAFTK